MPARKLPANFTASRALNLAGTAVAKGASVTAKVAAQQLGPKELSAFVSRGWLVPDLPQYAKTVRRTQMIKPARTPYYLNPSEIRQLLV